MVRPHILVVALCHIDPKKITFLRFQWFYSTVLCQYTGIRSKKTFWIDNQASYMFPAHPAHMGRIIFYMGGVSDRAVQVSLTQPPWMCSIQALVAKGYLIMLKRKS